jgi:hypothetical protein
MTIFAAAVARYRYRRIDGLIIKGLKRLIGIPHDKKNNFQ